MSRYLIVANQTLGGDKLNRAIEDRVQRGDSQFYVVVPMTAPQDEAAGWSGGFEASAENDKARSKAEQRLSLMIRKIRSTGGEAEGEVGDPDPVVAVKDVLRMQSFDEIIVSTLPSGLSGWLRMDLSSRVSRMAETPVTTVTAEG